ncbi:MAG: FliG C-terminal domain-containing protein [Planctomycetota bacterium]
MPEAATESPLRKAAVFVRSLAPDAAATMLARLSPKEAASLRRAIADLGEVASAERGELAEELLSRSTGDSSADPPQEQLPRGATATSVDGGAVELMLGGGDRPDATPGTAPPPTPAVAVEPFDLAEADPATIAEYLRSEQPTAIALALGQLSAGHVAAVLAHFPVEQQGTLLSRVAGRADADPESVRLVTDGLVAWVRRREDENRRRRDRIATIEEILSATPPEHRGRLLAQIRQEEPEIAAAIAPTAAPAKPLQCPAPRPVGGASAVPQPSSPPSAAPKLSDAQLERLDGATLASVARSLDSRTAILALATASESVVGRLAATLGRPAARDLRARLRSLGPATLSEIDRARDLFAQAAARVASRRTRRQDSTLPSSRPPAHHA